MDAGLTQVIDGGYCVGCGACAAVANSGLTMEWDSVGQLQPNRAKEGAQSSLYPVAEVCPFAAGVPSEDRLAEEQFSDIPVHSQIGRHRQTYAGYVTEGDYRQRGSSGGFGSWFLAELLKRNMVDAVIHVERLAPQEHQSVMFRYSISESIKELRTKSKSHYYPIEMSQVIQAVRSGPERRYAFVGIPCYVKAVRLLCKHEEILQRRIKYTVGLVCGHLKSKHFADLFAWQCGVHPNDVEEVDFRVDLPGQPASNYGIRVKGRVNGEHVDRVKERNNFYGYDWGLGFFKLQACDYCDDVLAETADVAIGDAWLPQYVEDSQGTNIVVVRHADLLPILQEGLADGRLHLDEITAADVALSQDAGLRHRREGLAYRLYLKEEAGKWHPPKRVAPSKTSISKRYRKIMTTRIELAQRSHLAFQSALAVGSFQIFKDRMQPLVRAYRKLYQKSLVVRALRKVVRIVRQIGR